MGVPKKKTSKMKRDQRRSHIRVSTLPLTVCKRCGAVSVPHRVCSRCGYYKGIKIIDIE